MVGKYGKQGMLPKNVSLKDLKPTVTFGMGVLESSLAVA